MNKKGVDYHFCIGEAIHLKRASLKGVMNKDLTLVIIYSLTALIIGFLFLLKHSGLSGDSIYYIDLATNIAQGKGFVMMDDHGAWLVHVRTIPLAICMPVYPFLVSLFIRIGLDSTLSARLVPLIFLTLIPFPMYYLTRNLYGRTIAHAATIALVFLWAFAYVGSYTWTETTFMFFILISILFLSKLLISPNENIVIRSKIIIAFISGISIGFAYMTKGNGILLVSVAFFVIFFLLSPIRNNIKHKTALFLFVLLGFSLVSSPWWIRNYLIFGDPFYHDLVHLIGVPTVERILRFPWVYGRGLFPLVLCLPYALKYLFDQNERKKFLLLASFPVITTLFFSAYHLEYRLLTPTFPFLIIIGIKALFDIARLVEKRFKIVNIFSNKILIIGLLILFILPQVTFTTSYYIYHTPNFLDTHSKWTEPWALEKMATYESIEWIKTNTTESDVILTNDCGGIYHYTRRNVVWTGGGPNKYLQHLEPYGRLDYPGLMDAINRLNISYVVLFKKSIVTGFREGITRSYDGDFVYNLSQGYDIPPNLDIVYDKEDAIIYHCEKK